MLPDSNGLCVKDDDADGGGGIVASSSSVKVSARVRDIVTRNLAPADQQSSTYADVNYQLTQANGIPQVFWNFVVK